MENQQPVFFEEDEPRMDPFEVPRVNTSVVQQEYVSYLADQGETFSAVSPTGYKIVCKDLDSWINLENGYLEVQLGSELNTDALSATAGVAAAGATQGEDYLPAVGAQVNKTIQEINTALSTRVLPDARKHDAIGVPNGWKAMSRARYSMNDLPIEDLDAPGQIAGVNLFTKSSKANAEQMRLAHMYTPQTWTPDNIHEDNDGSTTICLPLSAVFGSLRGASWVRGIKHTFEFTAEQTAAAIVQSCMRGGSFTAAPDELEFTAAASQKVWISRLRLIVPIVYPSNRAIFEYEQEVLSGASAIRLFEASQYYVSAPQTESYKWAMTSEDRHIKRIIFWVASQSYESELHNYNHQHGSVNLSSYRVRINKDYIPKETYTVDLANNDAVRLYAEYLRATERSLFEDLGDGEPALNYYDFISKHTFVCVEVPQSYTRYDNKSSDIVIEVNMPGYGGSGYKIHAVVQTEAQLVYQGSDNRVAIAHTNKAIEA